MDAEPSRAVTDDDPTSSPGEGEDAPAAGGDSKSARRSGSASQRLQATMAAADTAAEELLEAARAEARELIERAEQVATNRTAQLQTQAEILLTRANDLTQQAQALGEATRELTSSVNRVISIEAPAVTELELPAGEPDSTEAPLLEPAEGEIVEAEVETAAEPEPVSEAETASEPEAAESEAAPEQEAAESEAAPEQEAARAAEADPVLAELGALTAPAPPTPEPTPPEAEETPPAPAPGPSPASASPRGSGSQPPPSRPQPQPQPEPEPEPAAPEQPEGKKRRSLFSRLRRGADAEHTAEAQTEGAHRPRASAEAIAEVSPGHQMLARQMLLDGVQEEEVERRLREEFRVRDPGAVLDSLQLNPPPVISPTKAEGTNEREP